MIVLASSQAETRDGVWGREPNEAGAGPGGSGHPRDVTSYRQTAQTSKLVALAGKGICALGAHGQRGAKSVRNRGGGGAAAERTLTDGRADGPIDELALCLGSASPPEARRRAVGCPTTTIVARWVGGGGHHCVKSQSSSDYQPILT